MRGTHARKSDPQGSSQDAVRCPQQRYLQISERVHQPQQAIRSSANPHSKPPFLIKKPAVH